MTKDFPKSEVLRSDDPRCRAANSIAANIAEGHGREVMGRFIMICACPRFVDGIGNGYSFLTASVCSARLNSGR
ncbi:four helix bundle protein [Rhizobium mongolense]|uniref:four helix bundle protein n=1 Tax=Rhizobium mongolense TaxID=57676 RepID=UPI0035E4022F